MFALLFFIADVTLSGTDSKFLPIYIKKAKHLYKLYTVVDLKPLPIKGEIRHCLIFFHPGKNSMLTRPMLNIQILFTNYDIITYFLNQAFRSEHFISIKHRILNIEFFPGWKKIKQRRIFFVLGYLRILGKISTAIYLYGFLNLSLGLIFGNIFFIKITACVPLTYTSILVCTKKCIF
jgi:hypothetical protein